MDQCKLDLAEEYYQKALKIQIKLYGKEHINVVRSYSQLATIYQNQKKYDLVKKYCYKGLNISFKLLVKRHFNALNLKKSWPSTAKRKKKCGDKFFDFAAKLLGKRPS